MRERMFHILGRWFETPDERRWLGAYSAATALHATILLAFCLWGLDDRTATTDGKLDSGWSEKVSAPEFEPLMLTRTIAAEMNPRAGGSAAQSLAETIKPTSLVVAPPLRTSLAGELPVGGGSVSGTSLLATVDVPSAGAGGAGTGTGDGIGAGDAGGFFGIDAAGRTFVYVVDGSTSMYAPHDSPAKTRFGRVQVELVHSIANMTPEQGFFVLFFNSVPQPMPAPGMQAGTTEAKQRYLEWMARHRAGGNTNPQPALELALSLEPDVVYFLTDGMLPRGNKVLREVTKHNAGRTRIHTFAFGSRTGEKLLRELARLNGGEYHFVE